MQIIEGIGYSARAIIMSAGLIDGRSPIKPTYPTQSEQNNPAPWALWGTDNKLPIEMADHIENCGVLSAALDAKARIAAGKGIQPFLVDNIKADGTEELTWVNDPEIQDWLEDNNLFEKNLDFSFDKNAYGWRVGSLMLTPDRKKIARIYRKDVYETRLEKKNRVSGIIPSIYLSADWANYSSAFSKDYHVQLTALQEGNELRDLQSRGSGFEFAFIDRRIRNGRQYYPLPLWYAAREWVKVARSIPTHKNTMFKRQIQLQYVVTISQKYWENQHPGWTTMESEKKMAIVNNKYNEIDQWLSGLDNAYKSLYCGSYIDPVTGNEVADIKVEPIDDKVKDGKMLPDSSAANSEILFALMVNPALMGAGQPGGPYASNAGGSNVRESYLVQMMLMEEERKMNTGLMKVVKHFNGWAKRYDKPLVFRYQSGLLTTLDTGKSTKNENL